MASGASEVGVPANFNTRCIETFNEIRAVFDSETASLNGPMLFGGAGPYVRYEYDLQNFQDFMQRYAQPMFTDDIGRRVLKTAMLEMNVFLPHTPHHLHHAQIPNYGRPSNMLSEILGRTIREQRLNGILRYLLEFLSLHHSELLKDVLNYNGYMRSFPGYTYVTPVPMVQTCPHLVYTMIYERGSVALFQLVAKLDFHHNNSQSIDNCEKYGRGLFEREQDIMKITYLRNVYGQRVMLAGDGILHQYIAALGGLERPFQNAQAVDMITALVDLYPAALQHTTSEPSMQTIVRSGAHPSASTTQASINTLLLKLCTHLKLEQLTQIRDVDGQTVEDYAVLHRLRPILAHIAQEKMTCCILSQLTRNFDGCHMHALDSNLLHTVYGYVKRDS